MGVPSSSHIRMFIVLLGMSFCACPGADLKTVRATPISITDTATLKAHVGKSATVTGVVSRVGMSKTGFIVFINFEGVAAGGFTAVVKSENLSDIEKTAGSNLDAALPGRRISVAGSVSVYNDAPQIEIADGNQIKVSR